MKSVAVLRLHLVRRGRKRKSPLQVIVGAPQPDGDDWCCPVRIKGLDSKERRVFGVDSWQAMILALRLVEALLRHEVREGGELFWFGHKSSVGKLFANSLRV